MRCRMAAQVLLWCGVPSLAMGALSAGASQIDITPAAGAHLPMSGYGDRTQGHEGVHDALYVRALVVDDGSKRAAVVACETIFIPDLLWKMVSERVSQRERIPAENLLLTSVHTHGAPALEIADGGKEALTEYGGSVRDAIVEAVRQAAAHLRPARIGFGAGKANLNINRRARMADGGYWLGYNPDGPSDKTVGIVRLEDPSARPIAVLINYSVHGTIMGSHNLQITGDLPGATSRFVESRLGDGAVALWTSGAAGDQNPIHRAQGSDFEPVAALGMILGEEAVRVARTVRMSQYAHIRGAQKVFSCPGQQVMPGPLPRATYEFKAADPVPIRLSLLMIGHVALAGVSGEVLTKIAERLKSESPFSQTLMLTHCNGSSGYLPDDAAYKQISYEIAVSGVQKGCAEDGIVNGILNLMDHE